MTDINDTHTVKNPTATTFELFAESTASNSTPEPVDGTWISQHIHLAVQLYMMLLF